MDQLQVIQKMKPHSLPKVSIIVSTFNEEKVIFNKIKNLSSLTYPINNMEIIIVDDASTDATSELAKRAFASFNLNGEVIKNPKRIGLNASLNSAIKASSNDIICITDSDVTLEKAALLNAISVLLCMKDVGGVTGNIIPSFQYSTRVTGLEKDYRNFSNRSMLVESQRHSAFPGSGVLTVFKRSLLSDLIPVDYGSTDGNLSINIIKGGHRFVYVPFADVYEPMPEGLGQHKLQKIRRAKRLIQVMTHNTHLLFNGKFGAFGRLIFPLKFAMLIICPFLIVFGITFFTIFVILSYNIFLYSLFSFTLIFFTLLILISKRFSALFLGFLFHQFYLIIGLVLSFRKGRFWKKINRK